MSEVSNTTASFESSESLETGYRSSHAAVKKFFHGFEWMLGNLPRDQRWKLDTILHHGVRVAELLKLEGTEEQPAPAVQTARDELNRAFEAQNVSPELVALVDTCQASGVSPERLQELLQDGLQAAGDWTQRREFQTFDEMVEFANSVGGSLMEAAVPVLGFVQPGYEQAARDCGTGVLLLQLLANFSADASQGNVLLAQQDLEECEIVLQRIKLRQPSPEVKHLVRLYCHRIEKILIAGGKLVSYLDYDAKRSVTSLLATHWRMLMKMKIEPESILDEDGVLSNGDWFRLRSRHLLGLEGNIPIIAREEAHH